MTDILKIEDTNINCIFLYKQGNFFRAYNRSAMRFEKLFRRYRVLSKFVKKSGRHIYYLGFPKQNLESIQTERACEVLRQLEGWRKSNSEKNGGSSFTNQSQITQ